MSVRATSMAPSAAWKPEPGGASTSSASIRTLRSDISPIGRNAEVMVSYSRTVSTPAREASSDDHRDVLRAAPGAGAAGDQEHVGLAAQRHPGLGAGEPEAVAVGLQARLDGGGVGAGVRLGQREPAERLARRQLAAPAALDAGRPEAPDRRRDGVVHRQRERVRRVAAAELLEHRHALGEREALATHALRREQPEQPVARRGERGLAREPRLLLPAVDAGRDHLVGVAARGGAEIGGVRHPGIVRLALRFPCR